MAEVARFWSSLATARSRFSRFSFISWPARFLAVRSASRAFFSSVMAASRCRKAAPRPASSSSAVCNPAISSSAAAMFRR